MCHMAGNFGKSTAAQELIQLSEMLAQAIVANAALGDCQRLWRKVLIARDHIDRQHPQPLDLAAVKLAAEVGQWLVSAGRGHESDLSHEMLCREEFGNARRLMWPAEVAQEILRRTGSGGVVVGGSR